MTETVVREVLALTYGVAFAFMAVRAMVQWRRRHDDAALWFGVGFGALALVVALGAIVEATWGLDGGPVAVQVLSVALVAVHPPALLQFTSAFGGVTRIERALAWGTFAALVALLPFVDLPRAGDEPSTAAAAYSAAFVLAWTAVALRVTATLWFRSARRPGIVRGRMRLLAVGVVLLNVALVISASDADQERTIASALLATVAALVVLAGFAPSASIRTVLRQRDQSRLRAAVIDLVAARTEDEVRDTLLPATRDLLGVRAVAMFQGEDLTAVVDGYDDDELDRIRGEIRASSLPPGESRVESGRLYGRSGDGWTVVDLPREGAVFEADELEVLASIHAIALVALARLHDSGRVLEHEQQLQAALDIAGLGKWEWRIGEDVVWWSPRMYEIFGIPEQPNLTYAAYRALLPAEGHDALADRLAQTLDHDAPYDVDHRIVRGDGAEAFVHSRAKVTRDEDGAPVLLRGVTLDITDRKRAERELEDAVQREREIAERLRTIDELKSNILSAVSHELRTPLTAVHGLSILLQDRIDELDPEKRREIVGHLVTESERLASLFADLLDIDRLRRGVISPQLAPTDVRELVRGIVERRGSTRVTLDLDDVTCLLDAPKVERVVENLIANAEKHGGFDASVWVRARADGDGVRIRVEDDGPGVPEHLRDEVFEPFNRGEEQLGHAPGTGIGLALVAQFTRLHGGRAWIEARDGGGAVFVVTFPGVPVGEPAPTPA